jgi:hypothetical protein
MVAKKGILRIIEATIAILLVLGVLMVVITTRRAREEPDFSDVLPPLLDEIAKNVSLRERIVSAGEGERENVEVELEDFLSSRVRKPFDYKIRVCEPRDICGLEEYPMADIFAAERVVSSTLEIYDPKKVKIFLWRGS